MRVDVQITATAFDPSSEIAQMTASDSGIGAVVSFIGLMRDLNDDEKVEKMALEHYAGMTEKAISSIIDQAKSRWNLTAAKVIHRIGTLYPQDPIVLVVTASAHRESAFRACEFVIDFLKNEAPLWKKEYTTNGIRWVGARKSDRESQAKWREGETPN